MLASAAAVILGASPARAQAEPVADDDNRDAAPWRFVLETDPLVLAVGGGGLVG